ncbi:MAG: alpha/beta hydrolase, partial [Pseudomonadales bacterium]|nr:alpha/beta hydrolase [Pseudomonadales bacterium]
NATGILENRPLKLRNFISDSVQLAGVRIVNAAAKSGGYHVNRGISYGPEPRNQLDHYVLHTGHAEDKLKRPLVMFIYGGNWQSGHRGNYRFVADTLCSLGYDVVVPDYRLYPDVRFSDILSDVRMAITWVMNSEEIDSRRPIYVMGHSAGAQLGSLLCLNPALMSHLPGAEKRIAAFIGLSGPYDFYPYTEESHWDLFAPQHEYPLSQAVNFVRPDAPPLYLLHGKEDNRVRRGHSKSLMEKQLAVGGQACREVYEGIGHVDMVVSFSVFHRRKSQAVKDIKSFIDRTTINRTENSLNS